MLRRARITLGVMLVSLDMVPTVWVADIDPRVPCAHISNTTHAVCQCHPYLTFANIISVGKSVGNGRKTVNLKMTMILDQKLRTREYTKHFGLTCIPDKTVLISDSTFSTTCSVPIRTPPDPIERALIKLLIRTET